MITQPARRPGSLYALLLLALLSMPTRAQIAPPLHIADVRSDTLLYGTSFGGPGFEEGIVLDDNGSVYCAAVNTNSDGLPEFGGSTGTRGGGLDGYVACFNADGTPIWGRYYGGGGADTVTAGLLYGDSFIVTGVTGSGGLPGTTVGFQPTFGGGQDCFVVRFNVPSGSIEAATYYGAEGREGCNAVDAGASGLFLAGYASAVTGQTGSNLNGFVARATYGLDTVDVYQYGDVSSNDVGIAVAVLDTTWENDEPGAYVFTVASTDGNALPSTDGSEHQGGIDAYAQVLRYTGVGFRADRSSYVGGSGNDLPTAADAYRYTGGVHYDPFVATTLAMRTNSMGLETRGRAYNGATDGLIATTSYDADGLRASLRWYSGSSSTFNLPLAVRYDAVGTLVTGGFTFPDEFGPSASTRTFDPEGTLLGETIGGSLLAPSDCLALSLRIDYTLCVGKTFGPVPTTPDAFQPDFGGESDAMVQKWPPNYGYGQIINLTGGDAQFLVSARINEAFSRNEGTLASLEASSEFAISPGINYEAIAGAGQSTQLGSLPGVGPGGLSVGYFTDDDGLQIRVGLASRSFGDGPTVALLNRLEEDVTLSSGDEVVSLDSGGFGSIRIGDASTLTVEPVSGPAVTFDMPDAGRDPARERLLGALALSVSFAAGGKTQADFDLLLFDRLGRRVELAPTMGTDVESDPAQPEAFVLHPNYPNPFNPATTIRFEVEAPAHTRLVVLDVLGRVVAVLVDRPLAPGAYNAVFEADGLPSGPYFYRLEGTRGQATRMMTLLR